MPSTKDISAQVSSVYVRKLGLLLRQLRPIAHNFLNPQFFPPPTKNQEQVTRFFFFVTAIDHRTSPPGQSFEGIIDNQHFHGADLLWHLSNRRFQEDPSFFAPDRMADITTQDVQQWLTVSRPAPVTIRNPAQRAELLRDCGRKLVDLYGGSVLTLLNQAGNRLIASNNGKHPGLLTLLAHFRAYEDPANKKSFLLLKFLLRRQLWSVKDPAQIQIPVDNHLLRIALRTGIVTVSAPLASQLREEQPMTARDDITLRRIAAKAYRLVAHNAKRGVLELDDFFWQFGRYCCTVNPLPVCERGCTKPCYVATHLLPYPCQNRCPFIEGCIASQDIAHRRLMEPKLDTWYY